MVTRLALRAGAEPGLAAEIAELAWQRQTVCLDCKKGGARDITG